MFQVVPEPEFSAWFQKLAPPIAEEVATAVDVAAASAASNTSERLSKLLLWYEATSGAVEAALDENPEPFRNFVDAGSIEGVRSYLSWHSEVLRLLESSPFRARLAALEPARAAKALRSVAQLRHLLHAFRVGSSLAAFGAGGNAGPAPAVRAALDRLFELMGLDQQEALSAESGVRELRIDNVQPRLRVLFGLDWEARKLIAILGESLDRRYYGDSVRLAERRFREYSSRARSRAPEAT